MSDILRVTTPLVNKAQVIDTKRNIENIPQFNLQDITKVIKTAPDTELLMQNNGLPPDDKTSALLLDLLKDPAVAVSYLKNISMLQEIFNLVPANNQVLSKEIEELFTAMLLTPEELAGEMQLQGDGATQFSGDLFDALRGLLEGQASIARESILAQDDNVGPQIMKYSALQKAVVDVLKSMSAYNTRGNVMTAVANNLEYLARSLAPSRGLSEELQTLSEQFRQPGSESRFDILKKEVMALFGKVEESILFSPKMSKTISIVIYNMSRYSDGLDSMEASLDKLFAFIPGNDDREAIVTQITRFLEKPERERIEGQSKVLDKLIQIIDKQVENEEVLRASGDKLEKVVQSLLSSPCNFTPLLHFILPMQYNDIQSFMEIWINPNGQEDAPERAAGYDGNYHLFMVFDVGSLGRFNMELYVRDQTIDFFLFCPPTYTGLFADTKGDIARVIGQLGYKFGDIHITDLERERSLMEVFRSLPYKRTGVDVKI